MAIYHHVCSARSRTNMHPLTQTGAISEKEPVPL
jgi:hypothetical protein